MSELIFKDADTIRSIFEHARAAGKHHPAYSNEVADGAAVYLVHDQGVYIMSAAPERQRIDEDSESCVVAYAEGCHPKNDEDWWEVSRALVGGDDFVAEMPFDRSFFVPGRPIDSLRITLGDDDDTDDTMRLTMKYDSLGRKGCT